MRYSNLEDWLIWQESLHYKEIDLGLDRIKIVQSKLTTDKSDFVIITVAGTNGKGSCVATLESIFLAAGYKTGAFTSPHLTNYNERIKISGSPVLNEDLINSFNRIDQCRGDISLTFFEFSALAAMDLFVKARLDIVFLEVGLGGRLDAVNCFDPDVSLITMVDLDHTDWLGHDRESIFREKAGILRNGVPAVCGDLNIPQDILNLVDDKSIPFFRFNHEFTYSVQNSSWTWCKGQTCISDLPIPKLAGHHQYVNASCVLMVLDILSDKFKIGVNSIRNGFKNIKLAARYEIKFVNGIKVILDVAHNPSAARMLAMTLKEEPCLGRTVAVFAIRSDKNIQKTVEPLIEIMDQWHIAEFKQRNSAPNELINSLVKSKKTIITNIYTSVARAFSEALAGCTINDRIVVFGSFNTVSESLIEIELMSSIYEGPQTQ